MKDYFDFSESLIENGIYQQIDKIKDYIYGKDSTIFETLDFDDDKIYLEPLLTTHFYYSRRGRKVPEIRDLMFGYSNPRDGKIRLSPDNEGVAYVPNLGYFYDVNPDDGPIELASLNKREFNVNRINKIGKIGIELHLAIPKLLKIQFKEIKPDEESLLSSRNIFSLSKSYQGQIEEALKIIEKLMPNYYPQIKSVAKGIILFQSSHLVSFASRVSPGISYLNVHEEVGLVFFIVEILHQFGHNIFYHVINEENKFFKTKSETPLGQLNGDHKEKRTLYSAFHGLYTTTIVAYGLEILLKNITMFNSSQSIEILGRFADNQRRLRSGLEKMNLKDVFTEEGKFLYEILDSNCYEIYARNSHLINGFNVNKQPFVYNNKQFIQENLQIVKEKLDLLCITFNTKKWKKQQD